MFEEKFLGHPISDLANSLHLPLHKAPQTMRRPLVASARLLRATAMCIGMLVAAMIVFNIAGSSISPYSSALSQRRQQQQLHQDDLRRTGASSSQSRPGRDRNPPNGARNPSSGGDDESSQQPGDEQVEADIGYDEDEEEQEGEGGEWTVDDLPEDSSSDPSSGAAGPPRETSRPRHRRPSKPAYRTDREKLLISESHQSQPQAPGSRRMQADGGIDASPSWRPSTPHDSFSEDDPSASSLMRCQEYFSPSSWKRLFEESADHDHDITSRRAERSHSSSPEAECKCLQNLSIGSVLCDLHDFTVDLTRITWRGSSRGGEPVESVMGQSDNVEFFEYHKGAFIHDHATRWRFGEQGPLLGEHYQRNIYTNMVAPPSATGAFGKSSSGTGDMCDETLEIMFIITRFEYANLYHTMTDWYNVWFAIDQLDLYDSMDDISIVVFDAHPVSTLDDFWKHILSNQNFHYLGNFQKNGVRRLCARRAVVVPSGYAAPINRFQEFQCGRQPMVQRFREWVFHRLDRLVLPGPAVAAVGAAGASRPAAGSDALPLVLFEFREPYVSHPRVKMPPQVSRHIANRKQIESYFEKRAATDGFEFQSLTLSDVSILDQIRLFRRASTIIGVHGAGLSHVLFIEPASEETPRQQLVEILPGGYSGRLHFKSFAAWNGVGYIPVTPIRKSGTEEDMEFAVEEMFGGIPLT